MKQNYHEPTVLPATTTRSDGWTGERMAAFIETLADTGIVADACKAAGKHISGAYKLRRREPLFAAAWEAALSIARERLADTLLARSIEGHTEYYYKDGALVGERRVIDGRLGLAILKRLDKKAEQAEHPTRHSRESGNPGLQTTPDFDWEKALAALQGDDPDLVAEALEMLEKPRKSREVEEVEDPPIVREEPHPLDDKRVFWCPNNQVWMTNFPPPPGFDGNASGSWGDAHYERELSAEEQKGLDELHRFERAEERRDAEADRDRYFAVLKEVLALYQEENADTA